MTSNKEFLDNLAATDPQALQAWFDAEHFECPSGTQSTTPNLSQLYGILSDDDCEQVDGSDVDSGADSREQLERDITRWLDSRTGASVHVSEIKQAVGQWLDRQEAITTRQLSDSQIIKECRDWERWCKNAEKANRVLRQQVDNLVAERDEKAGLLETAFRRCKELQAQVDALNSESSEFADGQDYWHDKCDELQRKLDNLSHDLQESERFREELREELSIAYDHAHDLLARRDRGLA